MQMLAREARTAPKGQDHIKQVESPSAPVEPKQPRIPQHTDEGRHYDLTYSLFDNNKFSTMTETLEYLEKTYRFSFPQYLPFLKMIEGRKYWSVRDPKVSESNDYGSWHLQRDTTNSENAPGAEEDSEDEDDYKRIPIICNNKIVKVDGKFALLYYLGSIIWRANECIFCDRHFRGGAASVQQHMADCSHQSINSAMEDEIKDYYDWSSWYEEVKAKYIQRKSEIDTEIRSRKPVDVQTAIEDDEDRQSSSDETEIEPNEEPTIEDMLHVIGYYECGDQLIVGATKVLHNRKNMKQLESRGLDQSTLNTLQKVQDERRTNKLLALGNGEDTLADKRKQNIEQRKHIEQHDYRLQFRNHRLKNIVDLSTSYMMNNTGH